MFDFSKTETNAKKEFTLGTEDPREYSDVCIKCANFEKDYQWCLNTRCANAFPGLKDGFVAKTSININDLRELLALGMVGALSNSYTTHTRLRMYDLNSLFERYYGEFSLDSLCYIRSVADQFRCNELNKDQRLLLQNISEKIDEMRKNMNEVKA